MREHEQGARQGAKRRGKPWRTAVPDLQLRRRPDLVQRDFSAAGRNELWVADFTYLRCWEGLVFFAFVVDPYSHEVVGWQFAAHMRTDLVLDALRMALPMTERVDEVELVHHSDAGSQYTSYDYGQTLDDHQVLASIGSVGDAYDNARLALTLPTRTRDRRIRRLVQQRAPPQRSPRHPAGTSTRTSTHDARVTELPDRLKRGNQPKRSP